MVLKRRLRLDVKNVPALDRLFGTFGGATLVKSSIAFFFFPSLSFFLFRSPNSTTLSRKRTSFLLRQPAVSFLYARPTGIECRQPAYSI